MTIKFKQKEIRLFPLLCLCFFLSGNWMGWCIKKNEGLWLWLELPNNTLHPRYDKACTWYFAPIWFT